MKIASAHLLPLLLLAGCSNPNARASSAPAPAAPAAVEAPAAKALAPARPQKEEDDDGEKGGNYSKLTGVQLRPVPEWQSSGPAYDTWHTKLTAIFAAEKITCKRDEVVVLKSPPYRLVNAIYEGIYHDARKIGWKMTVKKSWADAVLVDMRWHGTLMYGFFVFDKDHLQANFCEADTTTAAKANKPTRRSSDEDEES